MTTTTTIYTAETEISELKMDVAKSLEQRTSFEKNWNQAKHSIGNLK